MRGGRLFVWAPGLFLAACSAAPPAPTPSRPESPQEAAPAKPLPQPDRVYRFDPPPAAAEEGQGSAIKGGPPELPARSEPPKRDPAFDDLLRLQKEISARNPSSDDEKLRLALLQATAGNLEEAERLVSTVRTRAGRLLPCFEFFLRRELGDHKEAAKLLAGFEEEERRVTGFVIERAELCQKIRRFRDYTPAETDRVVPGGVVLLYVEPRNFALQRGPDRAILHLRYDWKLFDDRSAEVPVRAWERATAEEREDRLSLNGPVNEFYQSFKLPLPANLAMGHYRIRVTVTDAHAGKSDKVYVPIYVTEAEKRP